MSRVACDACDNENWIRSAVVRLIQPWLSGIMRSIFFAFALLTATACATTPTTRGGRANVALVRSEINGAIRSQQNDRSIHSMGRVETTKAVVYTTNASTGAKQEETWVNDGSGWKLEGSTAIASSN